MKYLFIVVFMMLTAGCAPQSVLDSVEVVQHLDGSLIRDNDGCAYVVTRSGYSASALIRHMPELSEGTCKFKSPSAGER